MKFGKKIGGKSATVTGGFRSKLSMRDLGQEALGGLAARPGRTILTVLGTVLGIAALISTLGIAKTGGNQIVRRFDALAATNVNINPRSAGSSVLPFDAEDRLRRLNGVVAAGTLSDVNVRGALVRSVPVNDPLGTTEFAVGVKAASPGVLKAVRGSLRSGRMFDAGHSARGDRVVVLGPTLADRLGIDRVDNQPAIFIGDRLFVVIGIINTVARRGELLDAAVIPDGTARIDYGLVAPGSVQVDAAVGAAQLIATQAAIALSPNNPSLIDVSAPLSATQVKGAVQNDLNSLFLILGGVALLVGAIGIANVTLVSVLERTGEIGLRRAMGAARRHIAAQFLAESTVMGFLGGAMGSTVGIATIVGVSASRKWTPVLDPWIPFVGPLLGTVIGTLAGLYPSLRAASMAPVDALRAGT